MIKIINLLSLILFVHSLSAQITKADLEQKKPLQAAKEMEDKGYKMDNGWIINVGDTIYFGKGTLPTKHYAFIYESLTSWSNVMGGSTYGNDAMNGRKALKSQEAARSIVKKFVVYGTKRGGYTAIAVVGLGGVANYWVELDNAVDAGEIRSSKTFAPQKENEESASMNKIDKLKELKKLLDDGTLSKEEFDAEKKKVLNEE